MTSVKDLTKAAACEEEDLFFFETDHLALRGNMDYSELLKTLVVLQSQRLQAIKDYEQVAQLQKSALEDPMAFIERLKTGEKIVPEMLQVAEVPSIDWGKYKVNPPHHLLEQIDVDIESGKSLNADALKQKELNTFNKAWTVDEQKQLEELLIKYPPEPIELNRFKKIAAALGTRTVPQVTSRVQKYFLKLAKLGLPVPGRLPKSLSDKFKKCHPHQRFNHFLLRPSTFFPELDIPVKMDDTDIAPGPSNDSSNVSYDNSDEISTNYLLPHVVPYLEQDSCEQSGEISKANEALCRINLLKQIREIKSIEETAEERHIYKHSEFTCDYCDEQILGTRWHCHTCNNSASVDYCTDCMVSQMFSSEPHNVAHEFITIAVPNKKRRLIPLQSDSKMTSDNDSSDIDSYQFDTTDQRLDPSSGTDIDNQQNDNSVQENESDTESYQEIKCIPPQDVENHNEDSLQESNDDDDEDDDVLDFRNVMQQSF